MHRQRAEHSVGDPELSGCNPERSVSDPDFSDCDPQISGGVSVFPDQPCRNPDLPECDSSANHQISEQGRGG